MSRVVDDQLKSMGLPPLGTKITVTMEVSGLVDFGSEVQLMLPNKMFTYLPASAVVAAVSDE